MGNELGSLSNKCAELPEVIVDCPINPEGKYCKSILNGKVLIYDVKVTKSSDGCSKLCEFLVERKTGDFIKNNVYVIKKSLLRDLGDIFGCRYDSEPKALDETLVLHKFPEILKVAQEKNGTVAFIELVKSTCIFFQHYDTMLQSGRIAPYMLPFYFTSGMKVIINRYGFSRCALVKKVSRNKVECVFLQRVCTGRFLTLNIDVNLSSELPDMTKIHEVIRPANDDDIKSFDKIGYEVSAITGTQYLSYTGIVNPETSSIEVKNSKVLLDFETSSKSDVEVQFGYSVSSNLFTDLSLDQQCLISPFVPVFEVKTCKYIDVDHRLLKPVTFEERYYNELVLDEKYKKFLTGFASCKAVNIDTVHDKGKGVIFILSGLPGTGKTLTAEAVAEKMKLPLIKVNFGMLGTQPYRVQESLTKILKKATAYNAILLFDEADVFLEARTDPSDIERNAIVCTFLQLLEYHPGVIFLCTNRSNDLDSAIISRSILEIKYEPLSKEKSLIVWENMLKRVTPHWHNILNYLTKRKIYLDNGRAIRNLIHKGLIFAQESDLEFKHIELALTL